jgi:hypothetical protein
MIEQVDCLSRRVITLEAKALEARRDIEFLHGMLAKFLDAKPASSPSAAIADEEEEKWPVCECGNFAPRNNQWCRSCRDAWQKGKDKKDMY